MFNPYYCYRCGTWCPCFSCNPCRRSPKGCWCGLVHVAVGIEGSLNFSGVVAQRRSVSLNGSLGLGSRNSTTNDYSVSLNGSLGLSGSEESKVITDIYVEIEGSLGLGSGNSTTNDYSVEIDGSESISGSVAVTTSVPGGPLQSGASAGADAASASGSQSVNWTDNTLGMPLSTAAGSNLCCSIITDSDVVPSFSGGWSLYYTDNIAGGSKCYTYIWLDATVQTTIDFSLGSATNYAIVGVEIQNPTAAAIDVTYETSGSGPSFSAGPPPSFNYATEFCYCVAAYDNGLGFGSAYGGDWTMNHYQPSSATAANTLGWQVATSNSTCSVYNSFTSFGKWACRMVTFY